MGRQPLDAARRSGSPGGRTVRDFDGAKLFRLRQIERRLTQLELGNLAGVSRGEIGHLERGHRKPTVPTWRDIAAALGVHPNELLSADSDDRDAAAMA